MNNTGNSEARSYQIAWDIETKTKELNDLIHQAYELNLKVEIDTIDVKSYGQLFGQPIISVLIFNLISGDSAKYDKMLPCKILT